MITPAFARKWFRLGAGILLALGITSVLILRLTGRHLSGSIFWSLRDFLIGLAAIAPLAGLFFLIEKASLHVFQPIRAQTKHLVAPLVKYWPLWQIAVMALFAGISEELAFRLLMQGWLQGITGPVAAVIITGIAFGVCHYLNFTYALFAGLIGMYLGALYIVTGNLLEPIVTHAGYDFFAMSVMVITKFSTQRVE